jgi:hypothetical protein
LLFDRDAKFGAEVFSAVRDMGSEPTRTRMVKKLEWIEMAQLAVPSILFKSLSLKLP